MLNLKIYSAEVGQVSYALLHTIDEVKSSFDFTKKDEMKNYYGRIIDTYDRAIACIEAQVKNVMRIYEIYKPFNDRFSRTAHAKVEEVKFSFISDDYPLTYEQLYVLDGHPDWEASDEEWKEFTHKKLAEKALKSVTHSTSVGAFTKDCLRLKDGSYLFIEGGKGSFSIREVVADTYESFAGYSWQKLPEDVGITVDADDVKVKFGKFLINKKGTRIFMPTSRQAATHMMISYSVKRGGKGVETKLPVIFDRRATYRCRTLLASRAIVEL